MLNSFLFLGGDTTAKIGKIEIFSYAYEKNYGVNALALDLPQFIIFFSYDTPIALYEKFSRTLYVDTYPYSRTTAKHRNAAMQYIYQHYIVQNEFMDDDVDIKEVVKRRVGNLLPRLLAEML